MADLPRMNERQRRRAKRLIRRLCASSSQSPLNSVSACGENCVRSLAPPLPTKSPILRGPQSSGNCLPLDDGEVCPCPQLLTPVLICKYFRAAVLPADWELCAEIMGETHVRRCRICGAPVPSRSNAAKYCPSCALRERRRRDTERKRNRPRASANRGAGSLAAQGFRSVEKRRDKDLPPEGKNEL